jgi:pimeloyl-ACP methyl ester carboxylesterase
VEHQTLSHAVILPEYTYADDLAALIKELDLRDAVLIGHSAGGR